MSDVDAEKALTVPIAEVRRRVEARVEYAEIQAEICAADGVLAAATERQYRDFVKAIGLPELAADPEFQTARQRVARREDLLARVRARTSQMTSVELAAALGRAMVPYGYVNDMAAVFEQPGAQALLMAGEANGHALRGVHSCAFTGDAATIVTPRPPPSLHEHAGPVLREFLGLSDARIDALAAGGAFGALEMPRA